MESCGKIGFEASLETVPQAAFGINLKFGLSSSSLTLDSDRALFILVLRRDVLRDSALECQLKTADGSIKMDLRRDQESILRQNVWTSY